MRKSTLSTITLATLLCLSTNNYFLVGSAYAATKSAVSPDVAVSQPSAPAPQIQAQPAIAPAPVTVEIKSESSFNASPADKPINNAGNRESVLVNIETGSKSSPKASAKRSQPVGQPVEIVLENRSTGCKFKASSLLERNADLCNPEVAIAAKNRSQNYYQNSNVLYTAASGETAVQVRRLTSEEIAAMSLPSNGDKQMLFPLISPSVISSLFGARVHPVTGQVRFHQGTDLAAPEGTPVVAAFSGRVEIAGWLGGYGLIVVISHGDTHETRYAHLSEVLVKPGQEIKQGNVIGLVGSTGMATGPHLHFEIWQKMQEGLVAIDPTPQLILAMEQLQKYLAQSPKSGNKA
ncbi:peptidase, M23/M37 family [Pseudanabaena sp. lw0831]|uniref:M23 family metallopeptidase n=1 Tax=Pseudanabaena sp. lw0831 TaxID=1357935 RepID=UPI001A1E09D2|nr:M23 family metallopeptidase [Pseudanabaena sp. lw0831]GBO52460.1 peptidase, M23/M37 family [Pseudanabaena sp. lw0831]